MKLEDFKKLLVSNNLHSINLQDGTTIKRVGSYEYETTYPLALNSFILIGDVPVGIKIVANLGNNTYKAFLNLKESEFPINETRSFLITDESGVYFWNLYRQAEYINKYYTIDLERAFNLIIDERYRLALMHGIKVRSPFVEVEGLTIYKRRDVQKRVYKDYYNEVIQKRNSWWL